MGTVVDSLIMVASILAALGTIWAFIVKVAKPIQKLVERSDRNEQSNMLLLRYRIKDMCNKALRRGWILSEEIDEINEMFDLYVEQGGNGSAKSRVERSRNLPIKHHEEPWEIERIR